MKNLTELTIKNDAIWCIFSFPKLNFYIQNFSALFNHESDNFRTAQNWSAFQGLQQHTIE